MSKAGLKISSEENVLKAADRNLVLTSELDTLKLFTVGQGKVTVAAAPDPFNSSSNSISIYHGLGYKPLFFCFANNPLWVSEDRFAPYTWKSIGGGFNRPIYAIDKSNLFIYFYNSSTVGSITFTFKYQIFYNDLDFS